MAARGFGCLIIKYQRQISKLSPGFIIVSSLLAFDKTINLQFSFQTLLTERSTR
jgi:hypothetical protein